MAKIYQNILELVGHTPLVAYHNMERKRQLKANVIGKLEYFNPTGSVKDRIARNMIEAAERSGELMPGGTIIEGTSGNTGIGLAAVAAVKGYRTVIVMPDNLSNERIQLLKGYGAEIIFTPAKENMPGAMAKAKEILANTENAFLLGQGANPNNPKIHYETTGPEVWEDMDGRVDVFISAVGTGGTMTGAGSYLKEKNPDIYLIAVEPAACPVLSGGEPGIHKIQGIGGGIIPPVCDTGLYDEVITVTDEDAYAFARESAKIEGIQVGISSGAALYAAFKAGKRKEFEGKNIVVILPDSGERYLSSGIYDE